MEDEFKTKFQQKREQIYWSVYTEYNKLISVDGRSKVKVCEYLCEKYNIASISTIYKIRSWCEEQIEKGAKNN